jgi:hypothetical protein
MKKYFNGGFSLLEYGLNSKLESTPKYGFLSFSQSSQRSQDIEMQYNTHNVYLRS